MEEQKLKSVFELLASAGSAILDVYASDNFNEEMKADNSPVTRADKASSKLINSGLKSLFPSVPVLDEENTIPAFEERLKWKDYFLVDPLDGTKEFIKRNGEFCINLALINGTQPEEGWIYQPLAETGWYCKKGEGIVEFRKDGSIRTIEKKENQSELIRIATSRSFFKPREAELIEKIKREFEVEILHCGSSKKQVQMILGNADMYLKAGPCSEWDTAPGQLMVEEFGGTVFRQDNFEPVRYNKPHMKSPHFVMLNARLNTPEFVQFLKTIIQE
ncbi:inositol monophosphatase family protein [uncultured Draconibacterium sp.]|uniref:3'(2'),5'-bisphosphate nucleotidase CysQ family protein n=1 Tax=uncultured Draconibacterium sp. TaxID=1573823 RepID=UPI00321762DE